MAAFDPSVPRPPDRQAPALEALAPGPAQLAGAASAHLLVVAPDASDLPGSQLHDSTVPPPSWWCRRTAPGPRASRT
eukprot:10074659-Alexandrium_andersonii.AAC.1